MLVHTPSLAHLAFDSSQVETRVPAAQPCDSKACFHSLWGTTHGMRKVNESDNLGLPM